MKTYMGRRLFCCLFAALFVLCCLPQQSTATGLQPTFLFFTFEELRNFCDGAEDITEEALSLEDDLVISEDLTIPSGSTVSFRYFTVLSGATLTVMDGASVMTYGLTVQGKLINYGTVFQGDLSGNGETQDSEIVARIPGKVVNKGEMTLTDVFGKRNIDALGSHFTLIETDSFNQKLNAEVKKDEPQPSASPMPEVTPTPEPTPQLPPSIELRRQLIEIFDKLEFILPRLAFFFVLALFAKLVKIWLSERKKEKRSAAAASPDIPRWARLDDTGSVKQESINLSHEDHFHRDREKRMAQLDEWLKSGIIDRKEYNELKKRYKQE